MGESWETGVGEWAAGLGEAALRKTMWLEALESQEEGRPGPPWNLRAECSQETETAAETKVPQAAWEGRD